MTHSFLDKRSCPTCQQPLLKLRRGSITEETGRFIRKVTPMVMMYMCSIGLFASGWLERQFGAYAPLVFGGLCLFATCLLSKTLTDSLFDARQKFLQKGWRGVADRAGLLLSILLASSTMFVSTIVVWRTFIHAPPSATSQDPLSSGQKLSATPPHQETESDLSCY